MAGFIILEFPISPVWPVSEFQVFRTGQGFTVQSLAGIIQNYITLFRDSKNSKNLTGYSSQEPGFGFLSAEGPLIVNGNGENVLLQGIGLGGWMLQEPYMFKLSGVAVGLFESNNIGWAWWTIKKVDSDSGIMTIKRPEGYQKLIDYWSGTGDRPDAEEAFRTLMELAENAKIENCKINYPVLDPLFGR